MHEITRELALQSPAKALDKRYVTFWKIRSSSCQQPYHEDDARAKYKFRHQLDLVLPRFIMHQHDQRGFRLICDDFRYGNIIVNNASDLKIIAVIDWEWAYTAPYQIFCSAPRWLLIHPPISWEDYDGTKFQRYKTCLELFLGELEEIESQRYITPPDLHERLSSQMRISLSNGTFWFHEVMYDCFTGANNPAWKAICDQYPEVSDSIPSSDLETTVKKKMEQLNIYKVETQEMEDATKEGGD